ncbi:MAG: ATP-binding cassette domain-containing protein [Candidatus Hydrogenedens sp.]|nr:ATP-binding cassette domain-containing protein [Candidatus Hydrogenedens sp.]
MSGEASHQPGDVIRCEGVSLTFRLPERKQGVKDVFMSPVRALKTREFHALDDVSFHVGPSEILGVIGNNGAGKSTLLRILGGIYQPDRGSVSVHGRIGMLMELGAGFHPDLTGRENVYLNASLLGVPTSVIEGCFDKIVDWSGMSEFIDMEVRHYSSGMKARLGFAVAAELRPDVLLVDEVLSVGDADFRRRCDQRFEEFVAQGTTIVLVTHSLQLVRERCTRALWLDKGTVRLIGDPDEVLSAYQADLQEVRNATLAQDNEKRGDPENAAETVAETMELEAEAEVEAETQEVPEPAESEPVAAAPAPVIPLAHPSDANPPAMPAAPTQPKRWGIGGLRIEEVVLRTRDGERRYSFDMGQYMRFDLRFRAERPIEKVLFGIQLATVDGTLATGVNSLLQGKPADIEPGQGLASFEIPELLITNGDYLVSAFAFVLDGGARTDIDYWKHCSVFEVVGGPRWKLGIGWLPRVAFHQFPLESGEQDESSDS